MAKDCNQVNLAATSAANPVGPLHLLMLGALALAALLWAASVVLDMQPTQTVSYLLPLGFYGLATAVFVWRRLAKGGYSVFHIPVFFSLANFLRFGLMTLAIYADPSLLHPFFHGDYQQIRVALLYFAIGMLAYWAGCSLVSAKGEKLGSQNRCHDEPSKDVEGGANLPVLWLVYLLTLGVRAYEVYTTGTNRSLAAFGARNENVAEIQFFSIADMVGTWCFIVFAIERFSHPAERFLRGLFRVVFVIECFFGLLTGMKSALLMPFFLAATLFALINKKLKKSLCFAPFLALIVIYPLFNSARQLPGEGGKGIAVVQRWAAAVGQAQERTLDTSEWLTSGWDSTVQRLALLQEMALAMNLGDRAEWLKGDERWWMLPLYPFVPRYIWPSKPILLKGQRFSVATGSTENNSLAITIPGDLYLEFGFLGLLIGMSILGMLGQWLTNMISGPLRKESLFMYTAIFWSLVFLESDVFGLVTGLMKSLVMLWVFVKLIYVPRHRIQLSPPSQLGGFACGEKA